MLVALSQLLENAICFYPKLAQIEPLIDSLTFYNALGPILFNYFLLIFLYYI